MPFRKRTAPDNEQSEGLAGAEPADEATDQGAGVDATAAVTAPPEAPVPAAGEPEYGPATVGDGPATVGDGPVQAGYGDEPRGMIPVRSTRTAVESLFVRLIATGGIVGIGVVIAAIMTTQHSHGWLIGLVVSVVSVALAAILWSSRRL